MMDKIMRGKGDIPANNSIGYGYLFDSSTEKNKVLKVSVIISIIIHVLLLWIVFPEPKAKDLGDEVFRSRIVHLNPYKIYKPPKPPKKGSPVVKKRDKNILPIPDPTPDEPEPATEALPEIPPWAIESDEVGDYEFGYPDAPPGGTGWGPVYKPGGDVTPPVVIKEVLPHYPEDAKKANIQGKVFLEAIVDTKGIPQRIKVLYSPDERFGFAQAAIDALKKWRFRPGTKNGRPVAVIIQLEVDFHLL
jgi:TonB family protein